MTATTDPTCVHCGHPIRYQDASAKYRHVRNDRHGPVRCAGAETVATANIDQHVSDVEIALDGGQLHLDVDTPPCTCPAAWRASGGVRGNCPTHGAGAAHA